MNSYKKAIYEEIREYVKNPKAIFLGQQVGCEDFYCLVKDIDPKRRIEMPVAEELQLGMSIGMALEGYLPISFYQRMDFLPRACDQLVNHLDILKELSRRKFNPKIIIITTVGSKTPLDTGLQHSKDLTEGFRALLKNIKVFNPKTDKQVKGAFKEANDYDGSSLLIFYQDMWK